MTIQRTVLGDMDPHSPPPPPVAILPLPPLPPPKPNVRKKQAESVLKLLISLKGTDATIEQICSGSRWRRLVAMPPATLPASPGTMWTKIPQWHPLQDAGEGRNAGHCKL